MKPFPASPSGSAGLNVSLHLILLSLAIIAGFFLIFRELRRVEVDLHDAISRAQAASASQPLPLPLPSPVFRFNPPFVPTVTELPPVPEEQEERLSDAPPEPAEPAEPAAEPAAVQEDELETLSEDLLMARPAAVLREYLRKRDAGVQGNKQELVKRILAFRVSL